MEWHRDARTTPRNARQNLVKLSGFGTPIARLSSRVSRLNGVSPAAIHKAILGHILPTKSYLPCTRIPGRKTLSDHDLKIGLTNMTWSRAVGLLSTDLVVVIAAPITAIANATERAKNANRTSILRAVFVEEPAPTREQG
jgi:hypothetical protein